ncbi:MAG: DUF2339 domain-containing protein [Acidobacteriota bacterium]|nr:DUF2339 domain-containing protein [Acidobacteriota bacterium]
MAEERDDERAPERNGNIAARLEQLERALGEQSARLHLIEQHFGIGATPAGRSEEPRPFGQGTAAPPAATEPDAPTPTHASRDWPVNVPPSADESVRDRRSEDSAREFPPRERRVEAAATATAPLVVAPPSVTEDAAGADGREAAETVGSGDRSWLDLEAAIGGSWFNWIGIIALTLGVGFFLKYAFENQWIGPTGRVLLGGAAGCSLLALAERLRMRGYRSYAYVLSGGGILILYLSIYAAYSFYQLIGQSPAFLLMAAVTTAAVLLSARYDALPIAILGLIGGFMTPILLSRNVDNQLALFGYIALLDAGVLALAYFKGWRSLNYLSFAATVLMFAGWMFRWYIAPQKLWPTVFFLTLFFVMFSALAVLHNVLQQRPARWLDISLIIANATLYFATTYALLATTHHYLLGAHALIVAVFFALLFFAADRWHRADQLLALSYLGASVTFVTMAVAIQLDQHWATIGWAVEGLLLTWIGFRTERAAPRYAALPVLAVAVTHWFSTDMLEFSYREGRAFWPLLNARAVSCYVLIAACIFVVQLYRRRGEWIDKDEREILGAVLILVANALAFTLLTVDANSYFNQGRARLAQAGDQAAIAALENMRQFTLTSLWMIYGAIALAVGITRRIVVLRFAALFVTLFAVLKFGFIDLPFYNAAWHTLIFNLTFAGFVVVVGALAAGAYCYARAHDIDETERDTVLIAIVGAANLLAVLGLSVEAMGYFNREKALAWGGADGWTAATQVESWKQFVLTLIWSAYAAGALYFGLRGRRFTALRYIALGLLGIAVLKLLTLDVWQYSAAWHTIFFNQTFAAFAVVVAALAACRALYRHDADEGLSAFELDAATSLMLVFANLLALVGLSVEVMGHFNREKALAWTLPEGWLAASAMENWKQFTLSLLWTIYAAGALAVGLKRDSRYVRYGALGLLTLAGMKILLVDATYYNALWHVPLFNQTFAAFALYIFALAIVYFLYERDGQTEAAEHEAVTTAITIVAHVLAIIALSLEAVGHFEKLIRLSVAVANERRDLRLARQLSLSVIWAVYGGALLVFGLVRRHQLLRVMALLLLGVTILKVFFLDLSSLDRIYRIVSFIVLGAILLIVSFLYQQRQQRAAKAELK